MREDTNIRTQTRTDTETCDCGHDHSHDHAHNHTEDTACGCGHDHGHEEHNHLHNNELTAGISCDCGHDHSHDHGHDHSRGNELTGGVACSCGHDHSQDGDGGHVHTHDHGPFDTRQKVILGVSFVGATIGMFAPLPPIAKLLVMMASTVMAGYPLFIDGLKGLRHFSMDENMLMTIAVIAAFAIGEYPEAFIVTALFRIGNLMENAAVERSKRDIEALTEIRPDSANVQLPDGTLQTRDARGIPIGTTIVVKPGEKVPLDAVVVSGNSNVDTAALTGESLARSVGEGDSLLSGTVNLDGMLTCETTNSFEKSAASRIIELVKESTAKKGKTENFITRFSRVYTPCIIVAAAALAFLPPLLGFGTFTEWISRSLVFLVASCPCALVISIPLSFFAGIGAGSKVGVLVKGSKYIETLSKADTIVLDKTGTLTTGRLTVSTVTSAGDMDEDALLALAAVAESYSNHPMAQAVLERCPSPDLSGVSDYNEISGKGVSLKVDGEEVLCGSYRLMEDHGIDISSLPQANIYLSRGGKLAGCIELFDEPRPEAAEAIRELKALGIKRTVMLSGDSEYAAQIVREKVGLDAAYAELLPQDKVTRLEEIKETAGITVFVGDGINDAPVLARSDVGVAMGFGTDAAIEAADVVLLSENLTSLGKAIRIARKTLSIANFNIVFALGIKFAVLLLGALGLAQMWMAVFADVGVAILAVLNSTRVLKQQF